MVMALISALVESEQSRNIADTFDRIVERTRRGRGNKFEGCAKSAADWDSARWNNTRCGEDHGSAAERQAESLE